MKGTFIGLGIVGVLGLVVALVVAKGTVVPDGPVSIAWDHAACAHCQMQIGEPRYAAQLITTEGRVHDFDDLGCAIDFIRANQPPIHRLWFHGEAAIWFAPDEVGFTSGAVTPMGSGLSAVPRATVGARTWAETLRDYRHPSDPGSSR